jgi:hypothetical protein
LTRTSGVLGIAPEPDGAARLAWKVAMPTPTSDNIVSVLRFGPVTPDALGARVGHVDRDAMVVGGRGDRPAGIGLVNREIECGPDGLCGTSLPTVLALGRS